VDPLVEKYYSYSPYGYVANNPLRFLDPNGKEIINIDGGVRFTGVDAQIAFSAFKRESESKSNFSIHFVFESITPNIYKHTLNSFRKGQPQVLHYDPDKTRQNKRREEARKNYPSRGKEGLQRDEYPYASTYEGGEGANIAYVPSKENRTQGRDLSIMYRTLNDEDPFLVFPVPKTRERDLEPVVKPKTVSGVNQQVPVLPVMPLPTIPVAPVITPVPLPVIEPILIIP